MNKQMRTLRSGFLRSCKLFAERPALEVQGKTLTYGELYNQASSLTATLMSSTPGQQENLTAVFAYRSEMAFIGILSALFSGQGYVPLNRTFPPARTRTMLKKAGCRRMIVDAESEKQLDEILDGLDDSLVIVLPERDNVDNLAKRWPTHMFLGSGNLDSPEKWEPDEISPDSIAYLLFTSGSTGIPKGVMITHRNVISFIDAMVDRYQINENDRFSQMFDMTFDLSVFDMFVAWERGACVCCPTNNSIFMPGKFIRDSNLTIWFSVPSTGIFMKSMGILKPNQFPNLRLSLFCGEALPAELVATWVEAAPNSIIENLYGPTELTIACTLYRWNPQNSPGECEHGVVPIGKSYPGMSELVVDKDLCAVKPGEEGELLMTGPQMSKGYWQESEKTASAFVVPPGKELIYYRTGDRVRRPVNNEPLVYLGRMDQQIQILGHRVELGEVEAVLREEAGTDLAVAVGWPITMSGANGIVGFLKTPRREISDIITSVENRLPDFMVPNQWHILEEFPLNANGKVDRNALAKNLKESAMNEFSAQEVKTFLLEYFEEPLTLRGYSVHDISDDFDLLINGVIDSLGFLEMTLALQEKFNIELDFEEIDPEELSIIGPLCRHITRKQKENIQ
ncbi:AMP-binding protein [Planctomycetota bacterium]